MSFRLVEVHLPGHNYDQINILPHDYHGVLKILCDAGINPLTTIVVAYSHQDRDKLIEEAESKGITNITYTGTYGELPEENLDEFLVGSDRQWDFIITGRFWGACHYSAYTHLLKEIQKRNPGHVNFHFIKPLIDGINKYEVTDIEKGYGTYANDAFHTGLIFRVLLDGQIKHIECKNTKNRVDTEPSLPSSKSTIDLHFWTSLEKMIATVKEGLVL